MLAIIPARGGSKGLPGKNLKLFAGKPLIYYSINEAKRSKSISRIIVSTDSKEIADIAVSYGVECPFMRPKYLAGDNSLAIDNYLYTLKKINVVADNFTNDFIVLQPTSPLRNFEDIESAIRIFNDKKAHSVISVSELNHPLSWAKKIDSKGRLINYLTGRENLKQLNRQGQESGFVPNGAIFIFNYRSLENKKTYYTKKTYPYIMPLNRSVDIDTEYDFRIAELIYKNKL